MGRLVMPRGKQRVSTGLLGMACLFTATACSERIAPNAVLEAEGVPFTSMATLTLELSMNQGPALVEFAQNFNCARCDQMASTMNELRTAYSKDVAIHRANYLSASNRFQLGICPTYLFMLDGEVVGQLSGNQPYPIMAARLDDLVAVHRQTDDDSNNLELEHENDSN